MIITAQQSNILEAILRDCGKKLSESLSANGASGEWRGDQFKAAADSVAHNFLMDELSKAFPRVPVISEEDDLDKKTPESDYFIVDPLDGTASFAGGYDGWVTQVALIRRGRPILAGIYAPVSNEYFSAIEGEGAFCNGKKLDLRHASGRLRTVIDNYPEPRGVVAEMMKALGIEHYRESGSIGLKICRIADGTADLFFKEMKPRDWDLAPGKLVLEEAGGVLIDIEGCEIVFGGQGRWHDGVIATTCRGAANSVINFLVSRR